jgi:hypothetical protein
MKKFLLMGLTFSLVAVVFAAILNTGCGPALAVGDAIYQKAMEGKGCGPTASSCEGDKLLLCNADHIWELNTDCADFETQRTCCTIEKTPGCYRVNECEATQ